MTEPDKRRFSRISKKIRIGISELRYPMPEGVEAEAQAKDISKDGISFTTSTAYATGAILALTIELTGWQRHRQSLASKLDDSAAAAPLTAIVKVVWCTPTATGDGFNIGVRFEDIYEDDYNALLKQLEALSETSDTRNTP